MPNQVQFLLYLLLTVTNYTMTTEVCVKVCNDLQEQDKLKGRQPGIRKDFPKEINQKQKDKDTVGNKNTTLA